MSRQREDVLAFYLLKGVIYMGGRGAYVSRGKTVGLTVTYDDGTTRHFRQTKNGTTILIGGVHCGHRNS